MDNTFRYLLSRFSVMLVLMLCLACASSRAGVKNIDGMVFDTPEEALAEVKDSFASGDPERLVAIFGKMGRDIIVTGDPIADADFMRRISQKLEQRAELLSVHSPEHPREKWYKIQFGREAWNMRIPLVHRGGGWVFATEYAVEDAKETRRGLNEILASDNMFLLYAAQKEYFRKDHDGDGVYEYAQNIISTPGSTDGLYWRSSDSQELSPLHDELAKGLQAGYSPDTRGSSYFGYKYKILKGQTSHSRSDPESFLVDDNMTKGFGILAYPTNWGVSGTQSFLADSMGRVYRKDMGHRTNALGADMELLKLDSTWLRVEHTQLGH